jgi:hypothetical protein
LDTEETKIVALRLLTTSHAIQLASNSDILVLHNQLENGKIEMVALQSLTESHTSQIASNDGDQQYYNRREGWILKKTN